MASRIRGMNWPEKIEQILSRGYTLKQIADECGFASKGAVHDLKSGESATCNYERGERLLRLHRKAMRRKVHLKTRAS